MTYEFSGKATEVLILGSRHIGKEIPDSALGHTLEQLEAWQPDLVGVEVLPGERVDLFQREGGWLAELQYGGFPQALALGQIAQAHSGWTRSEAAQQAREATGAGQRVLGYLAALEPWNALLHLSEELALPAELLDDLHALAQSTAESVRLGVSVAKRLGHQRLGLIDDFPVEQMPREWWAEFEAGCETSAFKEWLNAHPCMVNGRKAFEEAKAANDYWLNLLYLNSPEGVKENTDLEIQANLRLGRAGRAKQADWDARNLFMAGWLRVATGRCPGGRVLAIVGSSHKGPLEKALSVLGPDLRILDLAELER